jgi:hypothetical protein
MTAALLMLIQQLDMVRPGWKTNHVLMHNNCPSYGTKEAQKVLGFHDVSCLYTASASFKALQIEGLF